MGKRDDFYSSFVMWPDDDGERYGAVLDHLGARLVLAMDGVLAEHLDALDGRVGPRGRYAPDDSGLDVLRQLSQRQRQTVSNLARSMAVSLLYRFLHTLDELPGARVEVTVVPTDDHDGDTEPVSLTDVEFHNVYFDWVDAFSDLVVSEAAEPNGGDAT